MRAWFVVIATAIAAISGAALGYQSPIVFFDYGSDKVHPAGRHHPRMLLNTGQRSPQFVNRKLSLLAILMVQRRKGHTTTSMVDVPLPLQLCCGRRAGLMLGSKSFDEDSPSGWCRPTVAFVNHRTAEWRSWRSAPPRLGCGNVRIVLMVAAGVRCLTERFAQVSTANREGCACPVA